MMINVNGVKEVAERFMIRKKAPSRRRIYTLHGQYRFIAPEWEDAITRSSLGNLDEWSVFDAGERLVGGPHEKHQVSRVDTDQGSIIFKRYSSHLSRRYFLCRSRATREWAGLMALAEIGIPVPELIGFGEDRRFGRLVGGYIIIRELETAMDLTTFARKVWSVMKPPEKQAVLREIRSKLFGLVKKAHRNHLFHGDLTWNNILVEKKADEYQLWFIDCRPRKGIRNDGVHLKIIDLSRLDMVASKTLTVTERYRSLVIFLDGDCVKARKILREITDYRANYEAKYVMRPAIGHFFANRNLP